MKGVPDPPATLMSIVILKTTLIELYIKNVSKNVGKIEKLSDLLAFQIGNLMSRVTFINNYIN